MTFGTVGLCSDDEASREVFPYLRRRGRQLRRHARQLQRRAQRAAIETEHGPLAAEFGIAVQPWSALACGFLTGKNSRDGAETGRLDGEEHPARRCAVLDAVRAVAAETGHTPAQVAMHWVLRRPGVAGMLVGARRRSSSRTRSGRWSWTCRPRCSTGSRT
ncbi:aldo/keto reductase [Amycolatopsis sp. NPDC023774]|uniref:aldo/keto reductase n=1 Tax=Amycolatopsis sp. NPDC023774 TaxID=3155015 RepID=UPI00340EFF52